MFERKNVMTINEVSKRYSIPIEILCEYEKRRPRIKEKTVEAKQYDQTDIERLSLILTLHDVGFSDTEIEQYMRLVLSNSNTARERSEILRKKRDGALDELHKKQQQLDRLDYLRFELSGTSKTKFTSSVAVHPPAKNESNVPHPLEKMKNIGGNPK